MLSTAITNGHLATAQADLRCCMDRLSSQVQALLGFPAAEGQAYIFNNRADTRIKALCVDRHGMQSAVRRLHQPGRLQMAAPRQYRMDIKRCLARRRRRLAAFVHRTDGRVSVAITRGMVADMDLTLRYSRVFSLRIKTFAS